MASELKQLLEAKRESLALEFGLEMFSNSFFPGNTPDEDEAMKRIWSSEWMKGFDAALALVLPVLEAAEELDGTTHSWRKFNDAFANLRKELGDE